MFSLPASLRRLLRRFLRAPLFSAVAVLTLGVGIGANAAIFSVVYGVVLKPLPFEEPDRLVGVWHKAPGLKIDQLEQGPAFYLTYRDENRAFERIGLWADRGGTVTGVGEPERVKVLMVTDGTLQALRVRPMLGRIFTREDDTPGSVERVVLTCAYWERRFGGDRGVVGRQVVIDDKPREIIGVLTRSFRFLRSDPAVLLPMRVNRADTYVGNFAYQGLARLRPGVTLAQANADIARMIPMVVERFPLPPGMTRGMLNEVRLGPNVHQLSADVIGDVGRALWVLFAMVGIVLLIACANVANLFLVRAEARQQELAIRAALGASRGRIARELLGESLALAMAGGVLGSSLAWAAIRLLAAIAPAGLPRLGEIGIDGIVLAFTLGVSVLAGLLCGLVAVARFASPRSSALADGGRAVSGGRQRHRARSVLVVSEIALALVLLVSSGLMIRTFVALRNVAPGYTDPAEVLTFRVTISQTAVPRAESVARMFQEIGRRLAQIPGVRSVGLSSSVTMDGNTDNDPLVAEDFPPPPGRFPSLRRYKWIGPGYFETMGNTLLAGRALTWADVFGDVPVVMVSENLAREYWKTPGAAIGRRVRATPEDRWSEIIGVVGNERDDGVAHQAPAVVYFPLFMKIFWTQPDFAMRSQAFAVRSARLTSPGFMREIQQAVWSVNPNLPLAFVRTLDDIRSLSMARTSFTLVMLAIAAVVALLLGIVGIYGVVAYIAAQRTREVGIRMALGAGRGDVSGMFVRHGLVLTGTGLAVGICAAAGLTRMLSAMLFGVSPADPLTYVAMSIGLGAVALLATWLPARRAARLDPVTALRSDG